MLSIKTKGCTVKCVASNNVLKKRLNAIPVFFTLTSKDGISQI